MRASYFLLGLVFGLVFIATILGSILGDNNAMNYCAMREVHSGKCVALVNRKYEKEVSLQTSSNTLIVVPILGEE